MRLTLLLVVLACAALAQERVWVPAHYEYGRQVPGRWCTSDAVPTTGNPAVDRVNRRNQTPYYNLPNNGGTPQVMRCSTCGQQAKFMGKFDAYSRHLYQCPSGHTTTQ